VFYGRNGWLAFWNSERVPVWSLGRGPLLVHLLEWNAGVARRLREWQGREQAPRHLAVSAISRGSGLSSRRLCTRAGDWEARYLSPVENSK
jgi:hypothetical protein